MACDSKTEPFAEKPEVTEKQSGESKDKEKAAESEGQEGKEEPGKSREEIDPLASKQAGSGGQTLRSKGLLQTP